MTNTSPSTNPEIEALLRDAAQGDVLAVHHLLEKHRGRLRRMIAARLDPRLAPRLDPSDVVQETLADAAQRLSDYLRDRPMAFYPWLYRLAADRLARTYKYHVSSTVRDISSEEPVDEPLPRRGDVRRALGRPPGGQRYDTRHGEWLARKFGDSWTDQGDRADGRGRSCDSWLALISISSRSMRSRQSLKLVWVWPRCGTSERSIVFGAC